MAIWVIAVVTSLSNCGVRLTSKSSLWQTGYEMRVASDAKTLVRPASVSPELHEIVRRLVQTYHPVRIYLFGSAARGDSGPNSDYDLLVLVPDSASEEQRRSRLAYRAL